MVRLPVLSLALFVVLVSLAGLGEASAQGAKPREISASGGPYTVVVTPKDGSGSTATLNKGNKKLWSKKLINEVAPEQVFVTRNGAYVVTVDEWHKAGTHPIVIYGKRGRKVADLKLKSLKLTDADLAKIRKSETATWWARGAYLFFGPKSGHLIVALRSGRLLVVRLKTGKLVVGKKATKLLAYGREWLSEQVVSDLASDKAQQRRVAAEFAGQLKLEGAVEALRFLLEDPASFRSGAKRVYYVRKAAAEALTALGEDVGDVILEE